MDLADDGDEGGYEETLKVMDLSLGRAPEPQSTNQEVCLLFLLAYYQC
jgi:RNA polymerase-associated protein LEO1